MASLRDVSGIGTTVNNLLVVGSPTSSWSPQASMFDIVDTNTPTYAIQPMARTGQVKFLVNTKAQRAAVLALLTCGRALVLVKDGTAVGVLDYCTTDSGIPQTDVPAWLPTSVNESWVADDHDEYLFLDVSWSQVTAETPVAL